MYGSGRRVVTALLLATVMGASPLCLPLVRSGAGPSAAAGTLPAAGLWRGVSGLLARPGASGHASGSATIGLRN